jgi:hypothetical protein
MPIDPNIALSVKTPEPTSPLQTVGSLMQMRDMASQIALRNAQTQTQQQQSQTIGAEAQQRQRDLADQNTVMEGMRDPTISAKVHTGDFSDFEGKIQPKNLDVIRKLQVDYQKALMVNTEQQNTLASAAMGRIVDTANGLKSLVGPDGKPDLGAINSALPGAIAHLQTTNSFRDAKIPSTGIPTSITDPSQIDQWLASIGGAKAATDQVLAQQQTKAETAEKQSEASLNTAKIPGAQAESGLKQLEFTGAKSMNPATIQSRAEQMFNPDNYSDPNIKAQVLNEQRTAIQAAIAAIPLGTAAVNKAFTDSSDRIGRLTSGVAQANATIPAKVQVIAGGESAKNAQSGLTPEALDMAAEMYRHTGTMPSLGMRNQYAMRQIFNRAAELGPLDIASEQAAYAANKSSLTGLVKNRDAVSAFENTAGKNLDLLLTQAKGVVDSGSPWINQPLRSVSAKALGNADVPAYNAARQVAVNEIAKVTSNPGLTGQLSDTARKEVESFNPENATLAQTYNVAKVLRQDMANRHTAYNEQISDITRRIGVGGTVQDNPGATNPGSLPQGNGKVIDSVTAQSFYQAAGRDPVKARQLAKQNGWTVQ